MVLQGAWQRQGEDLAIDLKVMKLGAYGPEAVAAESPIEFPADLKGDWAKADFLVNRLRNQGLSGRGAYVEAEVELVTGP